MKKLFLTTVGVLLFLAVPSLYALNNSWANNEDGVSNSEVNTQAAEGSENKKVKGAEGCPSDKPSPLYIKSGHFAWSATDIVLPGNSGIYFSRSYTSHDPLIGMFGNGWISNLESGFIETAKHINNDGSTETHYIYRKENGLRYTFKEVGGTIEAPSGMYYTFKRLSATSYTVTDQNKITDTYSNDHIISKEDANGNKREYIYDENGILQSIKDSNGNTLALTFGGNGYVTAITDQNARTWRYTYDEDGNLVSVTDPLDGQRNYTYEAYQADNDAQNYFHITKITDESDVVITEVEYDTGYTGTSTFINGRVKSYTQGEDTFTFDWSRLFRSYDAYVVKTDSLGNWTRLYQSESGHIIQYTDVYYKKALYNIDENMTLTGMTDKNGNDWNQSVDEAGRIVSKTTPLGDKTSYKYDGVRRVPFEITSALGYVTKIAYDAKENPTQVTMPDNSTYKATYDTKGNVLDATNPSGVKTSTITYNTNSQATSIKNALGDTLSVSYNALGQMTTTTDAEGNVVTYTHDLLGNMTKTVNAMGHEVVYTYDAAGRLFSLKDPAGNSTAYQYDTYGRVSKVTRPNGRTLTYTYNTANQLTTVTDSAGRETVLTYDKLGRVTRVTKGTSYINYVYDSTNKMIRAYDNQYQYVYFTYNADGQLTQEKQHGKAVDYTYDSDGNLASMSAMGTTITYTRNSRGALTSLSDGTDTFSFTYDANGQRKSIIYPNALQTTYGLDAASRLTTLNNGLNQNSYTYDKNGMMMQKTVNGTVTNYSYDAAGRLTDAGVESYSYDTAGNRLADTAIYDSQTNQLSQTGSFRYEYDAFGNMTKKTDMESGDYKGYTWNIWDQLTKVESFDSENNSVKKLEFTYGPLGRRLFKKVDGTTEKYLYSGSNMIATMNNYSNLTKRFVHDEAIDSPLSIVDVPNSESYYYHKDHLGSITGLSDSSQNNVEAYSYDAYGKTVKSSSVETGNTFAYTGREMDDDDLYYYRARYYDPTVGRFLSEDPIGLLSGDHNLYRYVLNAPLNFRDPSGLEIISFGIGGEGSALGGGSSIYGIAIAHDNNSPWYEGWSSGFYRTNSIGLIAGIGLNVQGEIGYSGGKNTICELVGDSVTVGGSIEPYFASIGLDTGVGKGGTDYAVTGGIGFTSVDPLPAESHFVTSTTKAVTLTQFIQTPFIQNMASSRLRSRERSSEEVRRRRR